MATARPVVVTAAAGRERWRAQQPEQPRSDIAVVASFPKYLAALCQLRYGQYGAEANIYAQKPIFRHQEAGRTYHDDADNRA